jgi:hypothetical protein
LALCANFISPAYAEDHRLPLEAKCRHQSILDPVFALGEFVDIFSTSLCFWFIQLRTVALDCSTPVSNCLPPVTSPPFGYCWWLDSPSLILAI